MKSTKKLTTDIFTQRSNVIHNNFYDYSKVEYINSATKVKIICPIHGEFEQRPSDHLKGSGCAKCGFYKNTRKKSPDKFIEEAKNIHRNLYDYSKVDYVGSSFKVKIICPIHGEFLQNPDVHLRGCGCPACGVFKNTCKKNTEDFIKRSTKIHNEKYDYSLVEYDGNKKKVKIQLLEF